MRQIRCRSLPVSASVVGYETPWKAVRFRVCRSRLHGVMDNLLGSFSERQGKGMRGWRCRFIGGAGLAAENREVQSLPGLEDVAGASNQYGARSLVHDTLEPTPRR
jgi:hypothetical protein